ncbi:hypothetical protein RvY_11228 [Ramazzottius varieornatus]|uniref:Uncharacterized protein n=1 Tax=Ramazzottius varieornatus TaxID=947166 RepID=A0A1D1VHU3_RAMVA|nr:hypothetical protein RvY_11228 [Ramazzottius varieornatus]
MAVWNGGIPIWKTIKAGENFGISRAFYLHSCVWSGANQY